MLVSKSTDQPAVPKTLTHLARRQAGGADATGQAGAARQGARGSEGQARRLQ